MPFARPSLTALRQQTLQDIASELPTGVPLRNSVLRIMADTQAGMAHLHYGYIDWIAQQSVPFTATGEFLEAWAALKGVLRNPAVAAKGTASFSGVPGSIIPAGATLRRADGASYTTDAELTLGVGGTGTVAISARETGAAGNADQGISLALVNAVVGVTSAGTAASELVGGAEVESDDSLRTRMNLRYASPAQGGSVTDYVGWALEVPGVTRAWCRPNGAGSGSVVLYTMRDVAQAAYGGFPQGTDGVAALEMRGTPATGDQLLVADHLFPLRPVTALVYSVSPIAQPVNFTFTNVSPLNSATQAGIASALRDLFREKGTPLGGTIFPSDINAALERVPNLDTYALSAPIGPISTGIGFLPTLGTLTLS